MFQRVASALVLIVVAGATAAACSQGEGNGSVTGTLNIPDCWNGAFDLSPDFFAASPYNNSLTIRIQRGSDFDDFSDGISMLVDDITKIRPNPAASPAFPGEYGQALRVNLPVGVTPPGTPVVPDPNPAPVAFALYLQQSCKTQTVTVNAVDVVTLPTDGTCTAKAVPGADPAQACAPGKSADPGLGTGKSTIAFTSLADGKVDEAIAAQRLSAGCFDVYLADPRDAQPGGQGPPPVCRGHLRGSFSFFFERGRPAQPFP